MNTGKVSRAGPERQTAAAWSLILLLVLGAPQARAQVDALSIQPGAPIPNIEVVNDGNKYTGLGTSNISFPVRISAQCEPNSRMESFYLITNTSRPDFNNQRFTGTVGADERGHMVIFQPPDASEGVTTQIWNFEVPVKALYSGTGLVPLKTCNELLRRKIKAGVNKTAVLAKDWRILQPLTISFMPACITRTGKDLSQTTRYWSKQSTTQLINYICKASEIAVSANKKQVAESSKRMVVQHKSTPEPKIEVREEKTPAKVIATVSKPKSEKQPSEPAHASKEPSKPVAISDVSVVADPREYTGECPALIAFKGKITAAQKGLIKFHFENSGRAEATRAAMFEDKDHTQRFNTQVLFDESKTGSVKLVIEAPTVTQAESGFKVVCKN